MWQDEAVRNAHECQEFLQVLGPVYGGSVFSYSRTSHTCSILDSGDRRCRAVSGLELATNLRKVFTIMEKAST